MSQESEFIKSRLNKANVRQAFNAPKDLFYTRVAFAGTITDNATTEDSLTGSGDLISQAIEDRLGIALPAATPSVVLLIDRIGFEVHTGVETDLIAKAIARNLYLKHTPANDRALSIDAGAYLTTSTKGGRNGVIATGAFGSSLVKAELYDTEVLMAVDLQRDGLALGMQNAVDSAANVPVTIWADVWAFHNRGYVRSDFVQELEGDGDQLRVIMERAKSNATRNYRYGRLPASAVPGRNA